MSSPARPLQNRVDPFGALVATRDRGTLMGNRGGRFHLPGKRLGLRRWASRQWIACVCDFKGRWREVWGDGYTELFFLDEVTALAAGHRPCFECRRADATLFRATFAGNTNTPALLPRAAAMDVILHSERLVSVHGDGQMAMPRDLPDGAMVAVAGKSLAVSRGQLLPWTFSGYGVPQSAAIAPMATLLTPPSIVNALRAGYRPRWHASAGRG